MKDRIKELETELEEAKKSDPNTESTHSRTGTAKSTI